MTFTSVTLPAAVVRWRLDGPAGPALDTLIAGLIGAGVAVEPIAPGTAYRLTGPAELLDVLADELAGAEGFTLAHELPPTDVTRMHTSLAPARSPARSFIVHGAPSHVARAIDRGLAVTTEGIGRWRVAGGTAALVEWQAAIYGKTVDEVLALFKWTAETVASEDTPTGPTINVTLPDRQTTSQITRDALGDITQIIQLESTSP